MDPSAHIPFLIAAYAVVWLGILVYVTSLARRSRELERELDELKHLLRDRQSGARRAS
jgi:CcmD family protein